MKNSDEMISINNELIDKSNQLKELTEDKDKRELDKEISLLNNKKVEIKHKYQKKSLEDLLDKFNQKR